MSEREQSEIKECRRGEESKHSERDAKRSGESAARERATRAKEREERVTWALVRRSMKGNTCLCSPSNAKAPPSASCSHTPPPTRKRSTALQSPPQWHVCARDPSDANGLHGLTDKPHSCENLGSATVWNGNVTVVKSN